MIQSLKNKAMAMALNFDKVLKVLHKFFGQKNHFKMIKIYNQNDYLCLKHYLKHYLIIEYT